MVSAIVGVGVGGSVGVGVGFGVFVGATVGVAVAVGFGVLVRAIVGVDVDSGVGDDVLASFCVMGLVSAATCWFNSSSKPPAIPITIAVRTNSTAIINGLNNSQNHARLYIGFFVFPALSILYTSHF